MGTNQFDQRVLDRALGVALGIGVDVSEITDVTGLVGRSAVGLAVGVDCREGGRQCVFLSS